MEGYLYLGGNIMEKLLMEVVRTGVRMLKVILHYVSHFSVGLSILSICVWGAGTFLLKQDMLIY